MELTTNKQPDEGDPKAFSDFLDRSSVIPTTPEERGGLWTNATEAGFADKIVGARSNEQYLVIEAAVNLLERNKKLNELGLFDNMESIANALYECGSFSAEEGNSFIIHSGNGTLTSERSQRQLTGGHSWVLGFPSDIDKYVTFDNPSPQYSFVAHKMAFDVNKNEFYAYSSDGLMRVKCQPSNNFEYRQVS